MPARNSISRFHGRYPFISKSLWKKYKVSTGSKISYQDFRKIISETMKEINKWVVREPIGFQLPYVGHIAVNKFKTFGAFKAYRNGKAVLNHNLHSGGFTHRIQWFKSTRVNKTRLPFWFFKACRNANRNYLGKAFKGSEVPNYNSFAQDHFIKKLPR